MRFYHLLLLFTLSHAIGFAQNNFWKDVPLRQFVLPEGAERRIATQKFRAITVNMTALKRELWQAPEYQERSTSGQLPRLAIPLPDGSSIEMFVYQNELMESSLAAKYPMIRSFKATAVDDPSVTGWFDYGVHGFHGVIYLPEGTVYIDPYASNQTEYHQVYYTADQVLEADVLESYRCELETAPAENMALDSAFSSEPGRREVALFRSPSEPITLRSYRLALAVTGEYSSFHAQNNTPTKEASLSAMVTAINRVNSVLERELAIRLLLIDETEKVIFLNRFNDPYTNGNTGIMIDENPPVLDSAFTRLGYDIGHVFGTNAGGLAQLQSVCGNGKARGVTCHSNPIGDNFYIDYVSHEIGHQFGAAHTFNNCSGNESSGTAFEPGSGSTIMSYSGLCGTNNIQFSSGDYYHVGSLEQMIRFSRNNSGNTCGAKTATSNHTPEVSIPLGNNFYIPISTPFELVGEASDPDGDVLLYNWEQYDLGPIQRPLGTAAQNSPLFRSVDPGPSLMRVFPDIDQILSGEEDLAEVLPDYSRDMTFRFVARDFHPEGGGVDWATLRFKATDSAGPFLVDFPNADSTRLEVGQYVEVKWDVANTNKGLVNCQRVNILLSLDGGQSFPIEWAMNTPNDGAEYVLVPDMTSGLARVRIEAADNIFFDVSDQNFVIAAPSKPGYSLAISTNYEQVCLPATSSVDIITSSLLNYDSLIELSVVSELPEGASLSFSKNPIVPSEQVQLQVDMQALTGNQVFELVLRAVAPNADTAYRSITFDVVSNDFSSFDLLGPVDGSSGLSGLPQFSWAPANDADAYNIEIATSPLFSEFVVDQGMGITDTFYQPGITLEENTLYYWRVQPTNRCGAASLAQPLAFHTESIDCHTIASENVPVNISASGTPTVQSVITVTAAGEISDLNIPVVKGSHDLVKHLDLKLLSPDGKEVLLFSDLCGNASFFDLGLDDEAPTEIPCPPLGQSLHQPQNPLSVFDGISTQGDWILQAEVIDPAGEGGAIDAWSIEFCSNINLSNPMLVINDTLPANPGKGRTLTNEYLLTTDEINGASELIYTLVSSPANGHLELRGIQIGLGDQFSQESLDNGELRYLHNGSPTDADHFLFTVIDGEGGWTGTHQFEIAIDESFVVSTKETLSAYAIRLYPNPTQGRVRLEFSKTPDRPVPLRLFNAQGLLVREAIIPAHQPLAEVDLGILEAGVYFLQMIIEDQPITKRVVRF